MTHEERLELIYRPFFLVHIGTSYPWSGTIVGDRFPVGRTGEDLLDAAGARVRIAMGDADLFGERERTPAPPGRYSLDRVPTGKRDRLLWEAILECVSSGMSTTATVKALGCSATTVARAKRFARLTSAAPQRQKDAA